MQEWLIDVLGSRYEYGFGDCPALGPSGVQRLVDRQRVVQHVLGAQQLADIRCDLLLQGGRTSSTDRIDQVARHWTRDGSLCFRSITGEVVQLE